MKKILVLLLLACLSLSLITSCVGPDKDIYGMLDDIKDIAGIDREDYENYTVFTYDEFDGKATLKMNRVGLGEGQIYYRAELTEGSMYVKYNEGFWDSTEDLITLAAGATMPESSAGGYIEGDEIFIIFETMTPVSGEIIISFIPIEDELPDVRYVTESERDFCSMD